MQPSEHQPHSHAPVKKVVLQQLGGVPYRFERVVCDECKRLLDERRVGRAAA